MKRVKCPICGKDTPLKDNPYRPFCSERCKTTDLGAWASGKYHIPGREAGEEASREEKKGEGDNR